MAFNRQSLLWRVDCDNLPHSSYIFGTMHVKDDRAFQNISWIYKKIQECNVFAAELDLGQPVQESGIGALLLPEGTKLSDLYSPHKYDKIKNTFLRMTKVPLETMEDKLPFFLLNYLDQCLLTSERNYSLDEHLFQLAGAWGKKTIGIETFEEHVMVLEKIPLRHQADLFAKAISNLHRHKKTTNRLVNLYEKGKLLPLYHSAKKSIGSLRKVLLYDRNELMAQRIAEIIQQESLFCAIGAAHLPGMRGVLKKLKWRGFRVEPVY